MFAFIKNAGRRMLERSVKDLLEVDAVLKFVTEHPQHPHLIAVRSTQEATYISRVLSAADKVSVYVTSPYSLVKVLHATSSGIDVIITLRTTALQGWSTYKPVCISAVGELRPNEATQLSARSRALHPLPQFIRAFGHAHA